MPKSNAATTAGEMFNGLKSRLGFSRSEDEDFSRFDADFDSYDDFDDDGYSPRYDSEYAGYGADYDENAPVGAFKPATTRSSRFGRADSSPDLVSIEDVKAHTPLPDSLQRDPVARASGSQPSRRSRNRNLVEGMGPAPSSPAYVASLKEAQTRSEGLNSLFESTAPSRRSVASDAPSSASGAAAGSYDPYLAYSSSTPSAHAPARKLTVIRPAAYGDVERVARALKAGDVVVLAMRNTPDDLSKRVLDFSFGVASALDASVECPAEKVFAIARGTALSDDEKTRLRGQGVL